MTSDSEVQDEGVEFLKKIESMLDRNNARFLFFTVVSSLVKKVNDVEPAKTAVLKIMEAFSQETLKPEEIKEEEQKTNSKGSVNSLFNSELCNIFLEEFLPTIVPSRESPMLFKTKKALLPCCLAIGEHLEYN